MSAALDLIITNGPLTGTRIPLSPHEPMRLGRSAKAYQLVDNLVSLSHAEISWEGDRYWLEDLDSVTGTFVNDERVGETPISLVPGMRIRIGETVLQVELRKREIGGLVIQVAALMGIIAGLVFLGYSWVTSIQVEYSPRVKWFEDVRQRLVEDSTLIVPKEFIRENGVDHLTLKIRRVTDFNGDNVDEMWLYWGDRERVVTFGPMGEWTTIAEMPRGCVDLKGDLNTRVPAHCLNEDGAVSHDFRVECSGLVGLLPEIECDGIEYHFVEGEGYRITGMDGVVVWMPALVDVGNLGNGTESVIERDPGGAPQPWRMTLGDPSRLSGFLAERGINEPVHYLICEDFDEQQGFRAEVLTESGRNIALRFGCINGFDINGTDRAKELLNTQPLAFAFTATGYRLLLEDLKFHATQGADELFLSSVQRRRFAVMSESPKHRIGSLKLVFDGNPRFFNPIAQEGDIDGSRRLLSSVDYEFEPQDAATHFIAESGTTILDVPGCSELEVVTNPWHCMWRKGCTSASSFLSIRNSGCGAAGGVVTVPYQGGTYAYRDDFLDARIKVDSIASTSQTDVLRTRVAVRVRKDEQ